MTIAQGLYKQTVIGKQSALGTPKTGAGGQILRRKTSIVTKTKEIFANDEISSALQDTGVSYGQNKTGVRFDGVLTPGTYTLLMAGILRKDFVAVSAFTASDVTAQATTPMFATSAGDFLAAGLKLFDVVRWTGFVGSPGTNNNGRNFWITALTATNVDGVFLDSTAGSVSADAAGDAVSCTVVGKKTWAPTTGHTNDFFTLEEWYSTISKSELVPDTKVNSINVKVSAGANASISIDLVGVGTRTLGTAQVLTSPAAETTTNPVQAVHAKIYANGAAVTNVTSMDLTISSGISPIDAPLGSQVSPDLNQGRCKVSGTFTGLFDGTTLQALFDAETNISLAFVWLNGVTATADFLNFVMGRVKLTGDAPDDGEKAIMRSYPFTAEINGSGSAALANLQTILSIQDSAAA